jgi:hypothetical protein
MPISSFHLSLVNDHLDSAIANMQLAADIARHRQNELHLIALKEARVNGLIEVVQWETRLREALLTLKDIRNTPGMAIAGRGAVPASAGRGDHPMDEQSSGGDELARPRASGFTPQDGQGNAAFNELLKACGYEVYCADRSAPAGVEA